tara:strand:+ start:126 stop:1250 length:1125 start_codon:yes stop_codon:yes gene_type:complete
MKISVLGAGNAGCFTALNYAWRSRKYDHIQIELIHNPEIPSEKVGQGTFPNALHLLDYSLGINWYNNPIHATPKSGILYEGWGKVNEEVFHPFPSDNIAMHYCPSKTQDAILKSGHFDVVEDDVLDPKEIDADYIFDCRGTPKDLTDYNILNNPINSAILALPNWNTKESLWTRAVATPDGWSFIIPMHSDSPSNVGAVGYLYNNNITSKEIAEYHLHEMFDVDVTRHLTFKNYVAKNPVIDGRIFLNGNRLFFLEPLEANAIQTYLRVNDIIMDQIIWNKKSSEQTSESILRLIEEVQNFILWHYQYGSRYDTPFWEYASSLSFDDPMFNISLNKVKKSIEENWDGIRTATQLYGHWLPFSMENWYNGMTVYK